MFSNLEWVDVLVAIAGLVFGLWAYQVRAMRREIKLAREDIVSRVERTAKKADEAFTVSLKTQSMLQEHRLCMERRVSRIEVVTGNGGGKK